MLCMLKNEQVNFFFVLGQKFWILKETYDSLQRNHGIVELMYINLFQKSKQC